ncbi:MAG: phosphonate C-P lyase system protein PhnH [Desulfobacteraceae bacterium]|nr:MAG: phosphonate C-P lyase system protein PhnH [Desulfobacteraceae bacterium]
MRMNACIDTDRITPGFADPVFDSQQSFRAIMDAMTHPGRKGVVPEALTPPEPVNCASAAICLSLLDFETPFWSDLNPGTPALEWLNFHSGCKIVSHTYDALFALVTDLSALPPLHHFRIGTDECPDTSTTLIVQVEGFAMKNGKRLTGPGIPTSRRLSVGGIPGTFWEQWHAQFEIFPLGVDVIFTFENCLAALPRSTRVGG